MLLYSQPFLFFFCLTLLVILLYEVCIMKQTVFLYNDTHKLLGKWLVLKISLNAFRQLSLLFCCCLLLIIFGIYVKLFLFICFFMYFIVFGQLGQFARKTNLYPFVLIFYAVLPTEQKGLFDTSWPELFVKTLVSLVYCSSFLQKIRNSGLAWTNGKKIKKVIDYHDILNDTQFGVWFDKFPILYRLAAVLTLIFEGFFWTSILLPSFSMVYGCIALLFHLMIFWILGINYFKYYLPVLVVYLTNS